MRLVLDTNVVVAGLLWNGHPRHLLDLAIEGSMTLGSSPALIDELAHTLNYQKALSTHRRTLRDDSFGIDGAL